MAATRKSAVRMYWRLRNQRAYPDVVGIESSPRMPLVEVHPNHLGHPATSHGFPGKYQTQQGRPRVTTCGSGDFSMFAF